MRPLTLAQIAHGLPVFRAQVARKAFIGRKSGRARRAGLHGATVEQRAAPELAEVDERPALNIDGAVEK